MSRILVLSALLACLVAGQPVHADPVHAIAGGAFWHHDSGWEFPQRCGEFELVGIPQDVAGSKDAVAYYALIVDGVRTVASVDVYPADSAAADGMAETAGRLLSESPFVVGTARALAGTRQIFLVGDEKNSLTALYFVSVAEWRVRIRAEARNAQILLMLDAFARDQRWDTLSAARTPR